MGEGDWGMKGRVNYLGGSPVHANCNPYISSVFCSMSVFPPGWFSDVEVDHEMLKQQAFM